MRVTEYEMIIYETIHTPTRGVNRISHKSQIILVLYSCE